MPKTISCILKNSLMESQTQRYVFPCEIPKKIHTTEKTEHSDGGLDVLKYPKFCIGVQRLLERCLHIYMFHLHFSCDDKSKCLPAVKKKKGSALD